MTTTSLFATLSIFIRHYNLDMLGRRHSYDAKPYLDLDLDSDSDSDSADREEITKQYIESAQRRMSPPIMIQSMTSSLATEDSDPATLKKMKSKTKEKRKKSKPRRSGSSDLLSVGDQDGSNNNEIGSLSGLVSPLVSHLVSSSAEESNKKKRSKKFRYNSEALGVVIIPDCDDACYDDEKEVQDKTAHFSSVTELTQMLDDDDCTTFTKETAVTNYTSASKDTTDVSKDTTDVSKDTTDVSKDTTDISKDTTDVSKEEKPKKSSKKGKKLTKEKRTKSKSRRSSRLNIHETKETSNHGSRSGNGNELWGDYPEGDKTFMSQKLLSLLLMDPALQIDGSDHNGQMTKPPSESSIKPPPPPPPPPCLQKSSSCSRPKKTKRLEARHSSVDNLNVLRSETKTRGPLRSKRFQEATNINGNNGTKNESWGTTPSTSSSKSPTSSYSPGILNLYTASKKPSPLLRRNLKSFNHVASESWRADPKRDDDIPSILFLSPENSPCNLNESLGSSNRQLDIGSPSSMRRKKSIRRSSTSSGGGGGGGGGGRDNEEQPPSTSRPGSVGAPRRKSNTSKSSCTSVGGAPRRKSNTSKTSCTSVSGSTPPRPLRRKSNTSESCTSFRLRKKVESTSSYKRNMSWAANSNSPSSNIPSEQRSSPFVVGSVRKKKTPSGNKNESWGMTGGFADSRSQHSGNRLPSISPKLVGMLMNDAGASPKATELYRSKQKSPSAMKKSMSLGAMKHSPSRNTIKKSLANFKKFRGGTKNELKPIPNLAN
jgi:hypothetical protein